MILTKDVTEQTQASKSKLAPSAKAKKAKPGVRKLSGEKVSSGVIVGGYKSTAGRQHFQVHYVQSKGVDDFVTKFYAADPIRLIETERVGVAGVFVKDLSKRMKIPAQRMFAILGVPKATAEKKVSSGGMLTGSGGRAALGMAKLLGIAQEMVESSTAPEATGFDSAKWLGQWLERPQPSLGGRRPAELIDTPTGVEVVAKLLGAIESGAYQ